MKIAKQLWFKTISCFLAAFLIRIVFYLNRVERHAPDVALPYIQGKQNAIFAFWHGRMMLMPMFNTPHRKMHVMISHHSDGEIIARTMHLFGFGTVRGSSSKGGAAVTARALDVLKAQENLSITPDGPRGPNMVAAPGAVAIAKLSGLPVVPVTFSATRSKRMKSWDRFMLALPFGRIAFVVGAPQYVPSDADDAALEAARLTLETSMRQITHHADQLCNVA